MSRHQASPKSRKALDGEPAFDLLVFSDDWGRHPSSCQHLVRELLPEHLVHWVNTIGTRRPRLDRLTLSRGLGKIGTWLRPAAHRSTTQAASPQVASPLMWPSFGSPGGRAINRHLLTRACRKLPRPAGRRIAVTTLPIVADLVGRVEVDAWVYYCVDDLSRWPGLDRTSLERMERELVAKVNRIVAVSPALVERMADLGRSADLLTHGVDLDHWTPSSVERPSLLEGLESPFVIFWGVVDPRLDVACLEQLDERLENGTILLIGPPNNPPERLEMLRSVRRVGAVPYDELPALAARAGVLIMPYADSPATRAMQPLKLKEYLATGRPVVTTALPAVEEWQDACDVSSTAADFAERVISRLDTGTPESQLEARRRLRDETWTQKAVAFRNLLLEVSGA